MPGLPILCCKGQRSKSAALPFAAENDKLVFVEYLLSLRASAHTGVAIPRPHGTRKRLPPKIAKFPRSVGQLSIHFPSNRGIATPVCGLVRNDS